MLDSATLTASPATVGTDGAATNCRDWRPWSFWLPTGSAPWELTADLGGAKVVNCAAFYGHDLLNTVGVDRWDGAAWVEVATTEAAGDHRVIYLTWSDVATTKLRFRFDQLSYLAILYAGQDVILPEGVAPGWSDPILAQRAKTNVEMSRGGIWLGTAVEYWDAELTLALKNVDQAWVTTYWSPFVTACSVRPFFMHWHQTDWPNSAILCTQAKFGESPFSQIGFIDVSATFTADTGRAAP